MRQLEFTGSDLDAVLGDAARETGQPRDRLRYEVLRESRGLLGVGTKRVWIRVEAPAGVTPAEPSARRASGAFRGQAGDAPGPAEQDRGIAELDAGLEPEEEENEDLGPDPTVPEVEQMVRDLLADSGLDLSSRVEELSDGIRIELTGPDRELLVDHRGEVLNALQYLVNRMAFKALGTVKRIQLESEGFRSDRDEELREMAIEAAEDALRSGDTVWLPPLNPYERRIVHVAISRRGDVRSESEGDGFVKRIAIRPASAGGARRRGGRGGSRGRGFRGR